MKILEVIHDFLPNHAAGSEIYTANLCRALSAAGHEVVVFTCEENRALEQHTLTRREFDGYTVHEAIYNRIYDDVSEHWDDPAMARLFAEVLDAERPDLVHVQGLQFVGGVSSLSEVARRGIPQVMTLHEYWWLCPRGGLMYDVEGRACETVSSRDCARCVDVYPIDRERWSDEACGDRHADLGDRRWFARALDRRERDMAAARGHVQRFIAPSRFLRDRFVASGFDAASVVHADYGFPPPAPIPPRGATGSPVRVGFVGTLSDYKGVELFARAAAAATGPLRCSIHGPTTWFPDVTERLRAVEATCEHLELAGPFAPDDKAAIYAQLDLLVVPSVWWENSPLTIHEAWQHGVPVLTSDRGGMAELVGHGGGASFPVGDEAALARALSDVAADPSRIDAWRATIPPVRAIGEDVALLERLHAELSAG